METVSSGVEGGDQASRKSNRVFVIAECCSSWRFGDDHLANAYRMIDAAKACGADAAKFQWTSDPTLMAKRRNGTADDFKILCYEPAWLEKLKAKCDEVGAEFMVTAFIEKDISAIAPLVSRFKVASAESGDGEFLEAHTPFCKDIIVSHGFGERGLLIQVAEGVPPEAIFEILPLHCVVSYPTPIEQLNLRRLHLRRPDAETNAYHWSFVGLSDHTTSVLSGAVAVGAGATIIEKHVRLSNTPKNNPDYGHSLDIDGTVAYGECPHEGFFWEYVQNIREAEAMMGTGEHVIQECEKPNLSRRVVQ